MEALCGDLGSHRDDEDGRKDASADQISKIHRHGHRIATGLPKRCRENLDDPEVERHFRNFCGNAFHESVLFSLQMAGSDALSDARFGEPFPSTLGNAKISGAGYAPRDRARVSTSLRLSATCCQHISGKL